MNSISLLNLINVFATVLRWHHLGDGARGMWLGQGECYVSNSIFGRAGSGCGRVITTTSLCDKG